MQVKVCIPMAEDSGAERNRLHEWCVQGWTRCGYDVTVASDGSDGEVTTDRFNHALAINCAVGQGDPDDVLVIADADTFAVPDELLERIEQAKLGYWSVSYRYAKLSPEMTEGILTEPTFTQAASEALHTKGGITWEGGASWSGVVVCQRDQFDLVGGYDPRFTGWSADDIAFAMSMLTLVGPVARMGSVFHLYHDEPRSRTYEREGFAESWALTGRYMAAEGRKQAMRRLIRERVA